MSDQKPVSASNALMGACGWPVANVAFEYAMDACQRSILFLDVLRERGNQHFVEAERQAPNVLSFEFEVILDSRTFDRPVNYRLVRIIPPAGTVIDPKRLCRHLARLGTLYSRPAAKSRKHRRCGDGRGCEVQRPEAHA